MNLDFFINKIQITVDNFKEKINPLIKENITNYVIQDNMEINKQKRNQTSRNTQRGTSRYIDKLMEQQRDGKLVKITYEEIGLFPRSFNRVFDRVLKQILSEDIAELALQEYRLYRYLFLTTIKCLVSIVVIPLIINFAAKNWIIGPLTEYFWNGTHQEIFLNMDQQKRAFSDLQNLEDEIYFETLTLEKEVASKYSELPFSSTLERKQTEDHNDIKYEQSINSNLLSKIKDSEFIPVNSKELTSINSIENSTQSEISNSIKEINKVDESFISNINLSNGSNYSHSEQVGTLNLSKQIEPSVHSTLPSSNYNDFLVLFKEELTKRTIEKTKQIYIEYNEESVHMVTNLISDMLSLLTLLYLLLVLDLELTVTKSFLFEMFFGLDDSRKSLIILLVTDLLVGYHSSNLWEVFFTFLFEHYGFNENHTTVYLLVATLPVLLDVLFKYLIFRHLNRTSPATVATYQALIE